jgi:hypothetical protein
VIHRQHGCHNFLERFVPDNLDAGNGQYQQYRQKVQSQHLVNIVVETEITAAPFD